MTTSVSPLGTLALPTHGSGPYALAVGPDGHVWCTLVHAGRIARLTPSTGHVEEFALDSPTAAPP